MPGVSMGLALWNARHRSNRSKGSISSITRPPSSPSAVHDGFGLPDPEDPDPFGVRALELAGLTIKEAGSHSRPSSDAFDYKPSPTSPVFRLSTQSIDGTILRESRRNSRRDSKRSIASVDHGTQTANLPSPPALEEDKRLCHSPPPIEEEPMREELEEQAQLQRPLSLAREISRDSILSFDSQGAGDELDILANDREAILEVAMPTVQILTRAQATPIESKPKLVNIAKRAPAAPALPKRNPLRQRRVRAIEPAVIESDLNGEDFEDDSSSTYSSPAKSSFDHAEHSPNPWSAETSVQDSDSLRQKDDINAIPDLDIPPLSDGSDGSSLAGSDATHHDDFQHSQQRTPYSTSEFGNTSGETLAMSVHTSGDLLNIPEHKQQRPSVDSAAVGNDSEQSLTHLVSEAPAMHSSSSMNISDAASVSSFYDDQSPSPLKEDERFQSASSIPLDVAQKSVASTHDVATSTPAF